MKIDTLQARIHSWANETFPDREFKTTMAKLVLEEIPEWVQAPDDAMEFADLIILIFDLASMQGINIKDAVLKKMAINEGRTWEKDKTGLFYKHIEQSSYDRTGPKCDDCGQPSEDRVDLGDFRCPECDIDWWQST